MNGQVLNNVNIEGLEELFLKDGKIIPAPFAEVNKFTQEQISVFCHKHAVYQVPTTELIEFIKGLIIYTHGSLVAAIEIGAGNGCIGRNVGIKMTDNKQQDWPEIKQTYEMMRQPTVKYGEDVETLAANDAVIKYKPKMVVGCWVTHLWREGMDAGNMHGVDEGKMFKDGIQTYLHIGNLATHMGKEILNEKGLNISIKKYQWLLSRSMGRDNNAIFTITKRS
jgi:hypothetical protein